MSSCRKAREIRLFICFCCLPIAVTMFTGCSDGIYEPYYDEPEDTLSMHDGQIAYPGLDFTILWNSDSIAASTVTLNLYRDDSFLEHIASDVSNNGEYEWQIPDYLSLADNYRILVMSSKDSDDYLYTSSISIRSYAQIDGYEPDNKPYQATSISPGGMAQMHAMSSADVDWFRFEATARTSYTIQTFGNTAMRIGLFTANGDSSIDLGDNGGYRYGKLTWQCDSGGTYCFKIFVPSDPLLCSYQVLVTQYTSPISDLVITYPDSGAVLTPGGMDTIVWQSPGSDGEVSISLVTDNATYVRSIASWAYNKKGRYVWEVPCCLDSSRQYRIRICDDQLSAVAFYSGPFSFALTPDNAEPDNSPSWAAVLSPDTSIVNRTITADDSDWFAFNAEEGKAYQIVTTGSTDMRLVLYGLDSATILKSNDDGYSYEKDARIIWTCPADGRYYFVAAGFTTATTGPYGIEITTGSAPAISVEAPSLSCTTGTSKNITWEKTGYSGELVRIDLLHDTTVRNIIIGADNRGYFDWHISQSIPEGGDYRIRVICISDTSVTAMSPLFQIVSIADEYEPDDSLAQADTSIVFGEWQQHSLPPNDSDWVAFTMVAGRSYSIGIGGINSVYLSLHRADGFQIASDSKSDPDDEDVKIRCLCANPGVYYALVRRSYSSNEIGRYGIVIFEE